MRRKRPGKNCRLRPVFALAALTARCGGAIIFKQNQSIMDSNGDGTALA
jgi:hypothetical protein